MEEMGQNKAAYDVGGLGGGSDELCKTADTIGGFGVRMRGGAPVVRAGGLPPLD